MVLEQTVIEIKGENQRDRLTCFGEYDQQDSLCFRSCALAINCVVAKNRLLAYQTMEDLLMPTFPCVRSEYE